MLREILEGHSRAAAANLCPAEVLATLGVSVSPIRGRCALLAFQTLLKLLGAGGAQ